MRRGATGIQLYDSMRVDCDSSAARSYPLQEPVSFFSDAALSADARYIAATGSCGGTYIYEVRLVCVRSFDMAARGTAIHMRNRPECNLRTLALFRQADGVGDDVQVDQPNVPPTRICHGPAREVTAVSWCPSQRHQVATCCEDGIVRVWNPECHGRMPSDDGLGDVYWQRAPAVAPSAPATSQPRARAAAQQLDTHVAERRSAPERTPLSPVQVNAHAAAAAFAALDPVVRAVDSPRVAQSQLERQLGARAGAPVPAVFNTASLYGLAAHSGELSTLQSDHATPAMPARCVREQQEL